MKLLHSFLIGLFLIGVTPVLAAKTEPKTAAVIAQAVKVDDFSGKITIKTIKGNQVIIHGGHYGRELLNQMIKNEKGKKLKIDGLKREDIQLTLEIPEHLPLDVTISNQGHANIGPRQGEVAVEVKDGATLDLASATGGCKSKVKRGGTLKIGNVAGMLKAQVIEAGKITISSFAGDAKFETDGDGIIKVKNGRANDLKASCAGEGSVDFCGTARDARLKNDGSGQIKVTKVTGKLSKKIADDGEIVVGG